MEGATTEVVAVATIFAMVVTKTVDLIRNVFGSFVEGLVAKATWNAAALGLGVAMALTWRVNILDNYSDPDSVVQGAFGQILTGLAIGGASSGYHEFFDLLSSTAKRAQFGDQAAELARLEQTGRQKFKG